MRYLPYILIVLVAIVACMIAPQPKKVGGTSSSVSITADTRLPAREQSVTVQDEKGATVYAGTPDQLAGRIQAITQNIADLQKGTQNGAGNKDISALQAELLLLTPIQDSITTKITALGLTDPATTTP